MARSFVLPDLGEGLVEAEISAVLVREGDIVKEDAPLLEVETDKAQVEIPSPFGGRVEKIHVEPGQTVKVGQVLVTFADGAEGAAPARASTTTMCGALSPSPLPLPPSLRLRLRAPPSRSRAWGSSRRRFPTS